MKSPAEKEPEARKAAKQLFDACMGFRRSEHGFAMDRVFDRLREELERRKTVGDELQGGELGWGDYSGVNDIMFNYTISWLVDRYGLETLFKAAENWPVPEIEQTPAGVA